MTVPASQTRDANALYFRASVVPSSVNEDARTVDVTWSTGAEVTRYDWRSDSNFAESLSMDPAHVRLDRLNNGAPVLDSHGSSGGVRGVLGVVEGGTARVAGGKGTATLRFSKRSEVDGVWQDIKAGILRNVSVGYVVQQWQIQRGEGDKLERRTAVDWEPYELSIVPIPADPGAQVRSKTRGEAMEDENTTTQPADQRAQARERRRCADITNLCQTHGVDAQRQASWLEEGATVDAVRAAILADIGERQRATHVSPATLGGSYRDRDMTRDAADALARRAGVAVEGEGHRHFGDAKLLDVARRVLESGGVNTRTLSGNEIATRALATSDFAGIVALAGQRVVRNAYDSVPLAHREILRRTTANDFRAKHAVSNASAGILPEVPEGGEYPQMNVSAEKASYALKTYGAKIVFTRQLLINDDWGMVESAARARGRSAAETERAVVWGFILGNPDAPDGNPMFDNTNHGNFPAASATPISATTLAAARKAMRTALSPDGFPVNGLLKNIVVAPNGETTFDQLLNGVYVPGSADTAMTKSLRNVVLHVEPAISASKSDWLGFTDFGQCDHFEYAYLSGSEGPRVEQRTNFDTDALELKVVLDFGIGAIDWRGVYWQRET